MRQLDIADRSLITLADGGDERTRGEPVMCGVGDLQARTDAIANEYDWIGRLLERLDDKPGSQGEAKLLRQARDTVSEQESELIQATSEFRKALGVWLEASKAVPAGVRDRVAGPPPKTLASPEGPGPAAS